ncbi:MAG: hypothetical protein WKF58_11790 [Ilumatobacteraceae bacterium]
MSGSSPSSSAAALRARRGHRCRSRFLNIFQRNMTSGIGFIAVALVYFGGWRPSGVLLGALLFSTINSLQLQIQTQGIDIPSDVTGMMPHIVTILVLAPRGPPPEPGASCPHAPVLAGCLMAPHRCRATTARPTPGGTMRNTTSRVITGLVTVTLAFAATSCGDDEPGADSGGTSAGSTSGTESSGSPATTAPGGTAASTGSTPSGDFAAQGRAGDAEHGRGLRHQSRIVRAMDVLQEERGGEENFELAYSENMFVVDDAAAAIRDRRQPRVRRRRRPELCVRQLDRGDRSRLPRRLVHLGHQPRHARPAQRVRARRGANRPATSEAWSRGFLGETVGFVGPIYVGSIAGSIDGTRQVSRRPTRAPTCSRTSRTRSATQPCQRGGEHDDALGSDGARLADWRWAPVSASVAENSDGEVGFIGFERRFCTSCALGDDPVARLPLRGGAA